MSQVGVDRVCGDLFLAAGGARLHQGVSPSLCTSPELQGWNSDELQNLEMKDD